MTDGFYKGNSSQIYHALEANFFPDKGQRAPGHTVLIVAFSSLSCEEHWKFKNSHIGTTGCDVRSFLYCIVVGFNVHHFLHVQSLSLQYILHALMILQFLNLDRYLTYRNETNPSLDPKIYFSSISCRSARSLNLYMPWIVFSYYPRRT